MRPIKRRLVVKPHPAQEKIGKFYIPDAQKELPLKGDVVAIGELVTQVDVGDTVLYGAFSGQQYKEGGDLFIIMGEDEVLVKL